MSGIFKFILGQAQVGQRKMAAGLFTESILTAALVASFVGIWTCPLDKLPAFLALATACIAGIQWTFGLLIGGNIGEHVAGALGGKKPS